MSVDLERVKSVFVEAVEQHPPERWDQYLNCACGSDLELRRNVDLLLAAHASDASLLDKGAIVATLEQPAVQEKPGSEIGPYKLREQIGEGGFGVVYVAEQEKPVARKVALKIIKPGMDTKDVIARFEAERQALALMEHPNIAKVLDAGATESGRPYFVMELVKGVPITEFCDEQKLPTRDRLQLFVDICRAIQHAHQKGIIHRDLKPSNVMVTMRDDIPVVKVIDFGVSKALSRKLTNKTVYTAYGQMIGTPLYMSPEQAQMSEIDVDTRSDVYSLGVLLYELLTGTTPFDKELLQKSVIEEMRRIICEVEPPRPSARVSTLKAEAVSTVSDRRKVDARKLSHSLRGELDWIVMKALEKDRNRRYESASEFAADVERFLNNEPVQACPPSTWYRIRKFYQRRRLLTISVAAIVGTVLIGLIGQLISFAIINKRTRELLEEREASQQAQADRLAAIQSQSQALRREANISNYRRLALAQFAWRDGKIDEADRLLSDVPEAKRNWVWHYLNRLCHSEVSEFQVPKQNSWRSAFSVDGKRLALVTDSGANVPVNVTIWDAVAGSRLCSIPQKGRVASVAFDNAGVVLAVGGAGGHVEICDASKGNRLWRFKTGNENVNAVAFSRDGQQIAVATSARITIWNRREQTRKAEILLKDIHSIQFADRKLIAGSQEKKAALIIWDWEQNQVIHRLDGLRTEPLTIDPSARFIAAVQRDHRTIQIVDIQTGKMVQRLSEHRGRISSLAFSPDGRQLASSGKDRMVILWNITDGTRIRTLRGHAKPVTALSFGENGSLLRSVDVDGHVKTWDPHRDQLVHTIPIFCPHAVLTPDGSKLAAALWDASIRLVDVEKGVTLFQGPNCNDMIWRVAISSDGNILASSSDIGVVRLWNLTTKKQIGTLPDEEKGWPSHGLAISPDDKYLAAAGQGRRVTIWKLSTHEQLHELTGHTRSVTELRYSRNGKFLVSGSGGLGTMTRANGPDGNPLPTDRSDDQPDIKVWDAATGDLIHSIDGLELKSRGLSISPDGRLIAATFYDGTVRLFDLLSGEHVKTLDGHLNSARAAVFHPRDATCLVTGDSTGSIKIWDVSIGKEILTIDGGTEIIHALEFSADGNRLVATTMRDVKIWDATPLKDK